MRVAFCGICHSDVSLINGTFPAQVPVVTQGHEASGTIAKLGPGVTGWAEGGRVVMPPASRAGSARLPARRRHGCLRRSNGLRVRRCLGGVHRRPGGGLTASPTTSRWSRPRYWPMRFDPVRRRRSYREGDSRIGRHVGRRRHGNTHRAAGKAGRCRPGDRFRH